MFPSVSTVTCVLTNVTAFAPFTVQSDKCYHQFAARLLLQSCVCFCILFYAWYERPRTHAALKDNAQGRLILEAVFCFRVFNRLARGCVLFTFLRFTFHF